MTITNKRCLHLFNGREQRPFFGFEDFYYKVLYFSNTKLFAVFIWALTATLLFLLILAFYLIKERKRLRIIQYYDQERAILEKLQARINWVTRSRSTSESVDRFLLSLTNSDLFGFDYAVFYEINFEEMKLFLKAWNSSNRHVLLDWKWIPFSGIPLDHHDIIAITARNKKNFRVQGNYLNGEPVDLMCLDSPLNREAFLMFEQDKLDRLFIPVVVQGIPNESSTESLTSVQHDKVVAVVEIGNLKTSDRYSESEFFPKMTQVQVLAENCALHFWLLLKDEKEGACQQILLNSKIKSGDNHVEYLQLLLNQTCSFFKVGYGGIALASFDHIDISKEDLNILYQDPSILEDVKFNPDLFLFESPLSPEVKIVSHQEYKNEFISIQYSTMTVPLKYNDNVIGCVYILGTRPFFFDEYNIPFITKIFSEAGKEYISKKLHTSLAELASFDSIHSDVRESVIPLFSLLKKYFFCSYIAVWLRDVSTKELTYTQRIATSDLEMRSLNHGNKSLPFIESMQGIEIMDTDSLHDKNITFRSFLMEHYFLSVIHIHLTFGAEKYGYIQIYSKRKLNEFVFNEDQHLLELIANKITTSLVMAKIVSSFSQISRSLVIKDLTSVLTMITDSAREILTADPVILFRNTRTNFPDTQTIISGNVYDIAAVSNGKLSDFIKMIEKENDFVFFERQEIPDLHELNPFQNIQQPDNFWKREHIRSLAGIVLKQEDKSIGVMVFCYRINQSFSTAIREMIITFSSFASTAISNAFNIELIREQQIKIEEKVERIQYENEAIFDKMQAMLPVANAASLVEIVRAMNHDIRNHLFKITQNLVTIKMECGAYLKPPVRERLFSIMATIDKDIENTDYLMDLFDPTSFSVSLEDGKEILTSVIGLFSSVHIKIELTPSMQEIPMIRCRKAEITMIVYNLISNAQKAIIEKRIKTGTYEGNVPGLIRISFDYNREKEHYTLIVEDNGVGIDSANMGVIYNLGFTTSREGKSKGIGLYFIKSTIERVYGGSISCESYRNKGTKFELVLKNYS